jgi:acetoin utilization deacetylase AcuC-like enzyme
MGFCLFNNAAVAAHWATAEGGAGRVAILDLDVHHGNGTQEIFYRRPDVLYFSTHQFPFYPGSGRADETGADAGTGSTVNVPMAAGTGDEAFGVAMERVMAPIVRRFAPDLIIVSLGFDAHWADPLAQLRLSLAGYAAMLGTVRDLAEQLCGGRMVVLLEGGYNLAVVGAGSAMVARLLAGVPAAADPLGPAPLGAEPERSLQVIEAVRELHGL